MKITRFNSRWSEYEKSFLASNWGIKHAEFIAKELGRTCNAVSSKANRMGLGSPGRGTVSASYIMDKTGAYIAKIKKVASGLGIKVLRVKSTRPGGQRKKGRKIGFDFEDALLIIETIKNKDYEKSIRRRSLYREWSKGVVPSKCVKCGSTKYPHSARGICSFCIRPLYRTGEIKEYPKLKPGRPKQQKAAE